jgi:hypothetical protein
VPSRFTEKISVSPVGLSTPALKLLSKIILSPCGAKVADPSNARLLVTLVCPEPSESITKMSGKRSRSLSKAIRPPSGDHSGLESKAAFSVS